MSINTTLNQVIYSMVRYKKYISLKQIIVSLFRNGKLN